MKLTDEKDPQPSRLLQELPQIGRDRFDLQGINLKQNLQFPPQQNRDLLDFMTTNMTTNKPFPPPPQSLQPFYASVPLAREMFGSYEDKTLSDHYQPSLIPTYHEIPQVPSSDTFINQSSNECLNVQVAKGFGGKQSSVSNHAHSTLGGETFNKTNASVKHTTEEDEGSLVKDVAKGAKKAGKRPPKQRASRDMRQAPTKENKQPPVNTQESKISKSATPT